MRTHPFQNERKNPNKAKVMIEGGYNLKQIRNETNIHPNEIRTLAKTIGYEFSPGSSLYRIASEMVDI